MTATVAPDVLLAELAAQVPTTGAVRLAGEEDVVDGVRPRLLVEPDTTAQLAASMSWAAGRSQRVFVRGGGTKLSWGAVPDAPDLLISTTRLDRVVAHRHGDLTATVEAGVTLAKFNEVLATYEQWLPLDPLWPDRATVGGVVSTNDSGPARHRHGAPRDLIIGCTVVLTDGQTAKSGGIVVKNVAGYDLARLLTGSFGSLGIIASATFKLAPLARHSRTVTIDLENTAAAAPLLAALADSPLTPVAVELQSPPTRLYAKFESVEPSVIQQAADLATLGKRFGAPTTLDGDAETRLWQGYADRWNTSATVVKVSTLPAMLVETLTWLESAGAQHDVSVQVAGRALLGAVEVGLSGDVVAQAGIVSALRERLPVGEGAAVLRQADRELRQQLDPWGDVGDALPLMRRVKSQFDPDGRLHPGRGPGGI